MRLPIVKRPHGFQELAAWKCNNTHPVLYWTKLGIDIHPCKNWFVTCIDIFLSEIEKMWFEMAYLLVLYRLKVTCHQASKC